MGRARAARRPRRRPQHHRPGRAGRGEALSADAARGRAERLTCWRGAVEAKPLGGGLTNRNFTVVDRGERFVVRIGDDIPAHRVSRAAELAAQRAAHAAGIAPEIVHAEPGALVMRFVEGRTLTAEDLRDPATLARVAALLRRCHSQAARHLRGRVPEFRPFDLFRHYDRLLREARSRYVGELDDLAAFGARLAAALGNRPVVLCHNDLLPANLIDDGQRPWLIDWEYAGLNASLFDLANLATNAALDPATEAEWRRLCLGDGGDAAADSAWRAMCCVSLLRELLWGMVSQATSALEIDYDAYVAEQRERLAAARTAFAG